MTRDEIVNIPGETGSVRVLGTVDVSKLIESLHDLIMQLNPENKQVPLRIRDGQSTGDIRHLLLAGVPLIFDKWVPGTEYLQSVANSFNIKDGRVRLLCMTPKSTYSFHLDLDAWRVHIPLVTNPDAFVIVDGKLWHMEVGKAYLMKVEDYHCAINAGDENRIHIVFDGCGYLA